MTVFENSSSCSGCGLCASMCPQKAIQMVQDKTGFFYPEVDNALCVNCDVCRRICAFAGNETSGKSSLMAYAMKHNPSIRQGSSSGGFFTALSDSILRQNGVVYGAVWTADFQVKHIRADNIEDRDRMRGSKYIQSDITGIYEKLRTDVSAGIPVLFTGTPCQCAAVTKLFEKKRADNLWIMDVICHGVLSQSFFDAYLADIQKKNPNKRIVSVNLRDKRFGWQSVGIAFDDGSVHNSPDDYFYKAYAAHALQRPSCFSCTCAKEARYGDFTVGDFWGCKQTQPGFYDELGISLVLANTARANDFLLQLKADVDMIPLVEEDYLPYQPNLRKPTEKGSRSEKMIAYYNQNGYKKTMHRFYDVTLMRRINKLGYRILQKILRK